MTLDPTESEAMQLVRDALRVVRQHAPAEVTISISSDKCGHVRIREHVEGVPLAALAGRGGADSCGGAT
jgi:hypothetical protein